MSIICLTNCAYLSETSRMIAVYKKLKELGADVMMASHGGTFSFELDNEKIPYEKIEPLMTPELCQKDIDISLNGPEGHLDKNYLLEAVKAEIQFFREKKATAIVTGFGLSAALSARSAGVPLIVSHLGSFVPPAIERNMFACEDHFDNIITKFIPNSLMNKFFSWVMLNFPVQAKTFNIVAKELGIEPVKGIFDILMGDLTLVTDVPEILGIPEKELEAWRPPNTRAFRANARFKYAGPLFAQLFGEIPDDVKEFLNTDKPKVYVALASSKKEYIEMVYKTLSLMDLRAVVCTMVHKGKFGTADNILLKDYLPSHLVMPMCDMAVIHGGQGSVQTAIASGIPLIGFPLQPEQNFNIKQVEKHSAALCMSIRNLKKGRLTNAVKQILENENYKKNMRKLQAFQATRDGALEEARKIIEFVK